MAQDVTLVLKAAMPMAHWRALMPDTLVEHWDAEPRRLIPYSGGLHLARAGLLCGAIPERNAQPDWPESIKLVEIAQATDDTPAQLEQIVAESKAKGGVLCVTSHLGFDEEKGSFFCNNRGMEAMPPLVLIDFANENRFAELKQYIGALELRWLLQAAQAGQSNFATIIDTRKEGHSES